MDISSLLFGLFGGLGLFIYGMNLSSKELKKIASFKIRKLINKLTNNFFIAILIGIFITSILQSSSATTVMLVSFINAGLISFAKTIGIIIGTNIGTTITVQLISFNLENYAVPLVGLAVLLGFFNKTKSISKIILGFALLFLGLSVMKEAVAPAQYNDTFKEYILLFNKASVLNFIILFIISSLITALIQASGATLGLLIALASSGLVTDFYITIPIILGARIGTCITAGLASLTSNRDGKRIALSHFLFNIISVIISIAILPYLIKLSISSSDDISRQIANAHTFISLYTALIISPFYKYFIIFVEKIIPVKKVEESRLNIFNLKDLNDPDIAISSIKKAIEIMANISKNMMNITKNALIYKTQSSIYELKNLEKKVNYYQHNIKYFLTEVSKNELSGTEAIQINLLREITDDFERIADHFENIFDNIIIFSKNNKDENMKIIFLLFEHIDQNYKKMFASFKELNPISAKEVLKQKQEEKELFRDNIKKQNNLIKECKIDPQFGMSIIDVIYNMQRITFHIRRILHKVISFNKS